VRRLVARALGVAPSTITLVRGDRSRDKVVRVVGLSLADVRTRLGAVVTAAVLLAGPLTGVAGAEHLTLDPGARPPSARPFDGNFSVRVDDGTFHIGGRVLGFGQSLGAWLRGRLRDGGVTVDGQLHGDRTYNFRLDAETDPFRPSLKIELYPGTL
jgi:hypothetical protein